MTRKMGSKKALNQLYLEKYNELGAETSANENGILLNILLKPWRQTHRQTDTQTDGHNDISFRQKNVTQILNLIDWGVRGVKIREFVLRSIWTAP